MSAEELAAYQDSSAFTAPVSSEDLPIVNSDKVTVYARNAVTDLGSEILVPIKLNKISDKDIVLKVKTYSDSAKPYIDYIPTESQVTIKAGTLESFVKVQDVSALNDLMNKKFYLKIESAVNSEIGQSVSTIQINNPDKKLSVEGLNLITANTSGVCGFKKNMMYCYNISVDSPQRVSGTTTAAIYFPTSNDIIQATSVSLNGGCALDSGGDIYCWGKNNYGQLAQDPLVLQSSVNPVKINSNLKFKFLSGNESSTFCGVESIEGSIYCWGSNSENDKLLGLNSSVPSSYNLVKIGEKINLKNIKFLTFGSVHNACAVNELNEIYCWGSKLNQFQVDLIPELVFKSNDDIKSVVMSSEICLLKSNGKVFCNDRPSNSQNFILNMNPLSFVEKKLDQIVEIQTTKWNNVFCARNITNQVYCWGGNSIKLFYFDSRSYLNDPILMPKWDNVSTFVKTEYTPCAVVNNSVNCLAAFEISTGNTLQGYNALGFHDIVKFDLNNEEHGSCFKNKKGFISCFKTYENEISVLDNRYVVPVRKDFDVTEFNQLVVVHTLENGCYVKNGFVFCWGDNSKGQLGNESSAKTLTPVQIQGLSNIKKITGNAFYGSYCVLSSENKVFCWGDKSYYYNDSSSVKLSSWSSVYEIKVSGQILDFQSPNYEFMKNQSNAKLLIKSSAGIYNPVSNQYFNDSTIENKIWNNECYFNNLKQVYCKINNSYQLISEFSEAIKLGYLGQTGRRCGLFSNGLLKCLKSDMSNVNLETVNLGVHITNFNDYSIETLEDGVYKNYTLDIGESNKNIYKLYKYKNLDGYRMIPKGSMNTFYTNSSGNFKINSNPNRKNFVDILEYKIQ